MPREGTERTSSATVVQPQKSGASSKSYYRSAITGRIISEDARIAAARA